MLVLVALLLVIMSIIIIITIIIILISSNSSSCSSSSSSSSIFFTIIGPRTSGPRASAAERLRAPTDTTAGGAGVGEGGYSVIKYTITI